MRWISTQLVLSVRKHMNDESRTAKWRSGTRSKTQCLWDSTINHWRFVLHHPNICGHRLMQIFQGKLALFFPELHMNTTITEQT